MNFFDRFYKPFDNKVEGRILEDSKNLTKDVNTLMELESNEDTFVKSLSNNIERTSKLVQVLVVNKNNLLHAKDHDEAVEEFLDSAKAIIGVKQYLLGSSYSIVTDAQEIWKIQNNMLAIAGSYDSKLSKQSLTFIKDEKDLIALCQTCLISSNSIISEAGTLHAMDEDEFKSHNIQISIKKCDEHIDLIKKHLNILQSNSKKINAIMVAVITDIKNIKTESIEIKSRLDDLYKMIGSGKDYKGGLDAQQKAILNAERKKVA